MRGYEQTTTQQDGFQQQLFFHSQQQQQQQPQLSQSPTRMFDSAATGFSSSLPLPLLHQSPPRSTGSSEFIDTSLGLGMTMTSGLLPLSPASPSGGLGAAGLDSESMDGNGMSSSALMDPLAPMSVQPFVSGAVGGGMSLWESEPFGSAVQPPSLQHPLQLHPLPQSLLLSQQQQSLEAQQAQLQLQIQQQQHAIRMVQQQAAAHAAAMQAQAQQAQQQQQQQQQPTQLSQSLSPPQPGLDSPHTTASKRKRAPSALALAAQESAAAAAAAAAAQSFAPLPPAAASDQRKQQHHSTPFIGKSKSPASAVRSMPASVAARTSAGKSKGKAKMKAESDDDEAEEEEAQQSASDEDEDEEEDDDEDLRDANSADEDGATSAGRQRSRSNSRSQSRSGSQRRRNSLTAIPPNPPQRAPADLDPASLKRVRLDRKAELARLARQQKKDKMDELAAINEGLQAKIRKLEKQLAAAFAGEGGAAAATATGGANASKKKKMKAETQQHNSIPAAGSLLPGSRSGASSAGSSLSGSGSSPAASAAAASTQLSALNTAESLQSEMNATTRAMLEILQRNDLVTRSNSASTSAATAAAGRSATNKQSRAAAGEMSETDAASPEAELQPLVNRMLELQSSRCLLSAEMSHAFESLLYASTGAPSSASASAAGLGSSSGATGGSQPNPGLQPLYFLSWLLSRPASSGFYGAASSASIGSGGGAAAGGLWHSLWSQEVLCSPQQIAAILRIKTEGSFDEGNLGSSNSIEQQASLDSATGVHGAGGMSDVAASASAPSSTLCGFTAVHASLLTSFEHFRSALIAHQQGELRILQQLMQILSPVQYAKFCKFAIMFGPVVMGAAAGQ